MALDIQQPGVMPAVSWYGKSSLHFIEGTLNHNSYRELLRDSLSGDTGGNGQIQKTRVVLDVGQSHHPLSGPPRTITFRGKSARN